MSFLSVFLGSRLSAKVTARKYRLSATMMMRPMGEVISWRQVFIERSGRVVFPGIERETACCFFMVLVVYGAAIIVLPVWYEYHKQGYF